MWLCATHSLPRISQPVADANRYVAGAGEDTSAFSQPGVVPGGYLTATTDQVYPAWDELRASMQRTLADFVEIVYEASDALLRMKDAYVASDDYAKNRVQAKISVFKAHATAGADYQEPGDRPAVVDPP
jgi:hypothetical protein